MPSEGYGAGRARPLDPWLAQQCVEYYAHKRPPQTHVFIRPVHAEARVAPSDWSAHMHVQERGGRNVDAV